MGSAHNHLTIRFKSIIQIRGFTGQLDQLEDRLLCKQEVVGSNPTLSTILFYIFSYVHPMKGKLFAIILTVFVILFGIFWIFLANSIGAPWYFILFGLVFVGVAVLTLFRVLSLR